MQLKSTLSILPNTTVYSPLSYCTPLSPYIPKHECFFQLPGQNLSNGINIQLIFKNTSGDDAGSVLYGGAIDNCKLTGLDSHSSGKAFDVPVHSNDTDYNAISCISSDAVQISLCKNNLPKCGMPQYELPRMVHPGVPSCSEVYRHSIHHHSCCRTWQPDTHTRTYKGLWCCIAALQKEKYYLLEMIVADG